MKISIQRAQLIVQPERGKQVIVLVEGESIRFFQHCTKSGWVFVQPMENHINVVIVVKLPFWQGSAYGRKRTVRIDP